MTSQPIVMPARRNEQRRHPRAPLNLLVRLRWLAPLGQSTEVADTLDVSRGGLLLSCREPCRVGALLWVTLPFDSALLLAQPEFPARVARVKQTPAGGCLVALEFVAPPRHAPKAVTGGVARGLAGERRVRERIPLALPIRVRPADSPWPEETMTVDVSERGVRFCTARLYTVGETLRITLPAATLCRGDDAGEVPARVVRLIAMPGAAGQQVAVALLPAQKA